MLFRIFTFIAFISGLLLSGCASFPQEEIAKTQSMPNVSKFKNKPAVYVDFDFYQGNPGASNAVESRTVEDHYSAGIKKIVESTKLFSSVTLDEFEKNNTDYTISLHLYNHGDVGGAAVSGFLTGFTLGIIPGAATDNYTLIAKITDKNNNVVASTRNKDSVQTWIGIWFIPVMGNTPEKAVFSTFENQIRTALKEMIMKGKLKYSFNSQFIFPNNA